MTPPQDELPVLPDKPKDTADLFEFRASEQDVVSAATAAETGGSNQSIYSAEEVNAEDSVFDSTGNVVNSGGSANHHRVQQPQRRTESESCESNRSTTATTTTTDRRCRSLGEADATNGTADCGSSSGGNSSNSSSTRSLSETNVPTTTTTTDDRRRNGTRSCENSPTNMTNRSSPPLPPPPTTIRSRTSSVTESSAHQQCILRNNRTACAIPPRWIPDTEAPLCMSCDQTFTTFRRRHHCRNCGGVFCGVCSNASTALPKFGIIKPVRVCRVCYHILLMLNE